MAFLLFFQAESRGSDAFDFPFFLTSHYRCLLFAVQYFVTLKGLRFGGEYEGENGMAHVH